MSISTETSKVTYNGNGSTTEFAIPFAFMQDSDLEVVLRDPAGVESVLALGADYSVDNPEDSVGGTLSMAQAPVASTVLAIRRDPAILQETHYEEGVPLSAKAREDALDLLTMICQATREKVNRTVSFPVSSTVDGAHVPDPDPGKYLAWDEAGQDLVNRELAAGLVELPLPVSQGGTGATSGDDGLAGLGLTTLGVNLVKSADAAAARTVLGTMEDGSLDAQVSDLKNLLVAEAVRRAIGDSVNGREYLGNGWVDVLADADEVNAANSSGYEHVISDSGYIQPTPGSTTPTTDLSAATHEDVSGSITEFVVDTANTSGHFDAAAGVKVLAGCRIVIGGTDYIITTLSNDGDATDEVIFDGTLAEGTYTVAAIYGTVYEDGALRLSRLTDYSYSSTYGSGDRTSIITVTSTFNSIAGSPSDLVDGSTATMYTVNDAQAAGKTIEFDFGEAVTISEAVWKLHSNGTGGQYTCKWQYWDGDSWDDVPGGEFENVAGSDNVATFIAPVTCTKIRMTNVDTCRNPSHKEVEFKTAVYAAPTNQQYTITLPGVEQPTIADIDAVSVADDDDSQIIRYAVSFDGGATFKYWNGSDWAAVTYPADASLTNWMTKTTLENITDVQWPSLTGDLVLAVGLKSDTASQTPQVPAVQWTVEGQTANMIVEFDAFTATDPDETKVVLVLDPVDEITLDTDLIAQVKRGEGAWIDVPLSIDSGYDANSYLVAGDADLSGGSGTETAMRLVSSNHKDFKVYAVSNTFRNNP